MRVTAERRGGINLAQISQIAPQSQYPHGIGIGLCAVANTQPSPFIELIEEGPDFRVINLKMVSPVADGAFTDHLLQGNRCRNLLVEHNAVLSLARKRAFHVIGDVEGSHGTVEMRMLAYDEVLVNPRHLIETLLGERSLHELKVVPCKPGDYLIALHLAVFVTDGIDSGFNHPFTPELIWFSIMYL